MDIPSYLQIDEFEIESFNDINSLSDLQTKTQNIEEKLAKTKDYIEQNKTQIESNYEGKVKELLQKEPEKLRQEKEILTFIDNC